VLMLVIVVCMKLVLVNLLMNVCNVYVMLLGFSLFVVIWYSSGWNVL